MEEGEVSNIKWILVITLCYLFNVLDTVILLLNSNQTVESVWMKPFALYVINSPDLLVWWNNLFKKKLSSRSRESIEWRPVLDSGRGSVKKWPFKAHESFSVLLFRWGERFRGILSTRI